MPVESSKYTFPRNALFLLAAYCIAAATAAPAVAQPYWLPVETTTTQNLKAVFALNSNRVWVGGDSGIILSTADGGATWGTLRGADSVYVTDIFMVDSLHAWAAAIRPLVFPGDWNGSLLYRTTDGGLTWSEQQHPDQFFNTLYFFDTLSGWVGGEFGLLLGTTDGGLTWSAPLIEPTIYSTLPVKRILFHSLNYGYAVGGYPESAGVIWRTTDGGTKWTVDGLGDALRGIHFVDSLNVFFAGGGFDDGACVTRSTNGGGSWSFAYVGPFGFATSLAFRNAAEGWAPLAFTGTSMFTTDTGATWVEYQNDDLIPTYGVSFSPGGHGYMVGDSGTVLVYNRPAVVQVGSHWNIVSLPVETGGASKDSLFPSAVSPAYRYSPAGYVVEDTLLAGTGYWLKFPSPEEFEFTGLARTSDSVAVGEGWNMIGTLSVKVDVSSIATIPPGILASGFFEFGVGYSAVQELAPGKGYWVKVSGAGTIVLTGPPD